MTEGSDRLDQLVLELKDTRREMRESFSGIYQELHGVGPRPGYSTRLALLEAHAKAEKERQKDNARRFYAILTPLVVGSIGALAAGAIQVYGLLSTRGSP